MSVPRRNPTEDVDIGENCEGLMRLARGRWDHRADDLLLATMEAIQSRLLCRFARVRDDVDRLHADAAEATITLQNVVNSFSLLSQTQFVQNCIAVEDGMNDGDDRLDENRKEPAEFPDTMKPTPAHAADEATGNAKDAVLRDCARLVARAVEQRCVPLFDNEVYPHNSFAVGSADIGTLKNPARSPARGYMPFCPMAFIGTEEFMNDPRCGYYLGKYGPSEGKSVRRRVSAWKRDGNTSNAQNTATLAHVGVPPPPRPDPTEAMPLVSSRRSDMVQSGPNTQDGVPHREPMPSTLSRKPTAKRLFDFSSSTSDEDSPRFLPSHSHGVSRVAPPKARALFSSSSECSLLGDSAASAATAIKKRGTPPRQHQSPRFSSSSADSSTNCSTAEPSQQRVGQIVRDAPKLTTRTMLFPSTSSSSATDAPDRCPEDTEPFVQQSERTMDSETTSDPHSPLVDDCAAFGGLHLMAEQGEVTEKFNCVPVHGDATGFPGEVESEKIQQAPVPTTTFRRELLFAGRKVLATSSDEDDSPLDC